MQAKEISKNNEPIRSRVVYIDNEAKTHLCFHKDPLRFFHESGRRTWSSGSATSFFQQSSHHHGVGAIFLRKGGNDVQGLFHLCTPLEHEGRAMKLINPSPLNPTGGKQTVHSVDACGLVAHSALPCLKAEGESSPNPFADANDTIQTTRLDG